MQTSNIGPQKTAFENLSPRAYFRNSFYDRLQNSPYFCVFKYARAVEQKVGNEAENRERDWGHTPYGRVILARFACVRLLRHTLPISLLILRKKPTVLQSTSTRSHWESPSPMSTTRYWPFSLQKDAFCEHWKELQRGWIPSNLISIPAGRKPTFSVNTVRHMRRF